MDPVWRQVWWNTKTHRLAVFPDLYATEIIDLELVAHPVVQGDDAERLPLWSMEDVRKLRRDYLRLLEECKDHEEG